MRANQQAQVMLDVARASAQESKPDASPLIRSIRAAYLAQYQRQRPEAGELEAVTEWIRSDTRRHAYRTCAALQDMRELAR